MSLTARFPRRRVAVAAFAAIPLLLAGCLSSEPAINQPSDDAAPSSPAPSEPLDLAALEEELRSYPGYLATIPPLGDSSNIIGAFTGSVPTAVATPIPPGYTLQLVGDLTPTRLRRAVDEVTRLPASTPPIPSDAPGVGPGSALLQTIPGEGTFICTANYVFQSGAKYYLGAAGHCFLPPDKKGTHGPDADYDASGVEVEVCVRSCFFGGQLTGFLGVFEPLGDVVYARQTGPGGDIGNDFGVVEVPAALVADLRPEMPVWGGPVGEKSAEGSLTPVVHYGNGIDSGTVFVSKGRSGSSLNDGDAASWQAIVSINGGDSGSAINHGVASADSDLLRGTEALGLVTHGIVTGGVPLGWGTTIAQAKTMATQAGLSLTMVEGSG